MTRISAGVKPIELCDKMLMAEHREIIRIPNTIKSGKAKVDFNKIPKNFKLGTGHVVYFYPKLKYLHSRYLQLYAECKNRGFNVQDYRDCFKDLPVHLYNDWDETEQVRNVVVERINTRLKTMKRIKYYGESIDYDYIKLL